MRPVRLPDAAAVLLHDISGAGHPGYFRLNPFYGVITAISRVEVFPYRFSCVLALNGRFSPFSRVLALSLPNPRAGRLG